MEESVNVSLLKTTVAFSVARFTMALWTPSSLFNVLSTLAEQAAHVIPPTDNVSVCILTLVPMSNEQ
jgi:hypothetical protein